AGVTPLSGVEMLADRSKPSEAEFGTPVANGCSKEMPYPPRTTHRPLPGFQANPKRGPKLFQSVSYGDLGHPSAHANRTIPGVPETGLIAWGSKLFMRQLSSVIGVSVSQRTLRFKVRCGLIFQSS